VEPQPEPQPVEPQPEPQPEQPVEPQPEQPVEPQPVEPQPEPAPARHEVFTDSLSPEWMDQSWSGFSASIGGGPDGSTAYQFACQAGWCAVRFVHPTGVALGEGGSLSFSHRRHGEVNATYKVWVVDGGRTMHVLGYVTPGPDWAEARFDLGAIGNVNTVVLQEHHGGSGGIILLDNLRFN
ncbi:MAG TPA: hypothetical protein PKD53_32395, partial [Chloroflexaceae bacterium]|nr:hypothetical protein [Chloroflexaceae bacterium]